MGIITTELQFPGEAPFGRVVQKNTIMDAGIVHLVNRFVGSSAGPFTHLQIGTGARYVVGKAKPIPPDRSSLFTFYDEQEAGRQVIGNTARYTARFEFPLNVAINEDGIFAGSHDTSPVMLSQATFMDTVQRMSGRRPTTDTVLFSVTWSIPFCQLPRPEDRGL